MRRNLAIAFAISATVIAVSYVFIDAIFIWRGAVGVDVSHHQNSIDWSRLARTDVAFAYIKATEGGDYVDRKFEENWRGAAEAGILRGAYHFFRQCRSGEAQAKNFIAHVPKAAGALPPVVDVEDAVECAPEAGVAAPELEIATFLSLLEAHYGCRPIIYTTPEYERAYLPGKLSTERFWLRSLFLPPQFREEQWIVWQYHNRGARDGVVGPVDLNVFRGTRGELKQFAAESCPAR